MYTAKGQLDRDALIRQYQPLVRKLAHHMMAKLPASVQVDDLAAAGPLLDGATFAITDALRLQGMAWEMNDDDALIHDARTDAIDRAERQAKDLADTAGLTLGEIVAVDETPASDQMLYASMSAEGIPFNPGSLTRYVLVTVTYSVAD
jgi:uncharacterized protein YggE